MKCTYDHNLKRINAFCIELIASNPAYSKAATDALDSKHGPDGGHEESTFVAAAMRGMDTRNLEDLVRR